jgi:hypothetical protein
LTGSDEAISLVPYWQGKRRELYRRDSFRAMTRGNLALTNYS